MATDRQSLRRTLRARRAAIPADVRRAAAYIVADSADHLRLLRRGQAIGAYLAVGSELDATPLIELAWRRGCQVHVPVIIDARHHRMAFAPLSPGQSLYRDAHGIPAPDWNPRELRRALDLQSLFIPLVGFDAALHRLGSGAGYYDRALAYRRWRAAGAGPRAIGIGFESQRIASLAAAPWDVPLDLVITEAAIHRPPIR